jgi:hypothetical protein
MPRSFNKTLLFTTPILTSLAYFDDSSARQNRALLSLDLIRVDLRLSVAIF